ncbi:MAG: HAD-IA family hydrolase [Gammaproteobacteria bacterium]|nr:HAD-IA family hydrolase [Gammaproteobacteria bacterium]
MTLPKAIIVDLDDTILDSGDPGVAWLAVCREAADLQGVTAEGLFAAVISARDWFWASNRRAREGRLDLDEARLTIFRRAFSALGAKDVAAHAIHAMATRYTTLRDQAVTPFPGALQALARLRSTGVKLALLTNGSAEKQREKIARFDLERFFDHVQVEGELGIGKPDPRAFESVLGALGVASADAWMVGDNLLSDIEGAQRVGVHAIWIDAHGNGLPTDEGVMPDRVISSLSELLP